MSEATGTVLDNGMHQTAQRILGAAADLFSAEGFRAVTVKDITDRCGVTQAALYVYFNSKDALLSELIRIGYSDLTRRLDAAETLSAAGRPALRLQALVGAIVEYGTESTVIARVADREWRALSEPHRTQVVELRRDVRRRFELTIRSCLDEGLFALGTISEGAVEHRDRLLATAIIDMCLGVANWYSASSSVAASGLVDGYQDLVLAMAGLGPEQRDAVSAKGALHHDSENLS